MQSVVVTGTSTGIGWGTAKVLIARGFRVFGSVRKTADAERLAAEFGSAFVPLVFDVTDEDAVGSAAARVGDALAGEKLFGLVNNAGIAVVGPLLELPLNDFRQQIDTNLTGVVIATKAFAPAARYRPHADGGTRPHRQYQLGRRQERHAVSVSLFGFEICAGGIVRRFAARARSVST